ncbi:MAG: hypothetical protein ABI162_06655 [Luteolibacter sp.]
MADVIIAEISINQGGVGGMNHDGPVVGPVNAVIAEILALSFFAQHVEMQRVFAFHRLAAHSEQFSTLNMTPSSGNEALTSGERGA